MEEKTRKTSAAGRVLLVLAVLLAALLLTAALLLLTDQRGVRFYVFGDGEMTLEYGTPYTEPGVYAVTAGRVFGESAERLPLVTEGAVDPGRLGTYVLRYMAHWLFSDYVTERVVRVVDTTPPEITLKHIEGYEPTWLTGYAEEGYTAWDACDGDLTGRVVREKLEDRVRYTVTDSSGNTASTDRLLPRILYRPPVITLLGGEELSVPAGLTFEEPGWHAEDGLGNDLSDLVTVEGEVTPWLAGTYEIRYSISSERGEDISVLRSVTVTAAELPEPVVPKEKTIYLTFDDGPGAYTEQLLAVLDKYDVKATFFVTNQEPEYLDLIGRAYRAGHSIGVHTCSHVYDEIYADEAAFFKDFFAMEEVVKEQTGSYTRIFRFPGGSSNTISSFNKGIMSRLTRAMNDMGYQYFDWNVYSGDAGGVGATTKTAVVAENIEKGCLLQDVSVVLQHDIKAYSVAAVESVIRWGLDRGYRFAALQPDSPHAHHEVNN